MAGKKMWWLHVVNNVYIPMYGNVYGQVSPQLGFSGGFLTGKCATSPAKPWQN